MKHNLLDALSLEPPKRDSESKTRGAVVPGAGGGGTGMSKARGKPTSPAQAHRLSIRWHMTTKHPHDPPHLPFGFLEG